MCKEQRATFQKTILEDSGKSHQIYSVNLTRVQAWATVIVTVLTILSMFFGGAVWVHSEIRRISKEEFRIQLESFHKNAQPAIAELIESKIEKHALIASQPFDNRLKTIEERITALEVTMSLVIPELKGSVDKNSDKLDRVLDRLMEKR